MLERPISKTGWTRVRFDQMAMQVNDRVDIPAEAGVEYYVGLEHLDADSLRIRRWGEPTDVESTKLRFKPGDIIFGKRRVYQRKVAVAEFEGICSAHAMVLRAKSDAILPEFLPFFMQSDLFMERALGISVGSLSPTINWKALAAEEFLLPPLQEQARMVDLGSACLATVDSLRDAADKTAITAAAYGRTMAEELAKEWPSVRLAEISDVQYDLTVNQKRGESSITKPYLRVANVQRGFFDLAEIKEIGVFEADRGHQLEVGDVLVVEGHANRSDIGRAAIWNNEIPGALHQNHLIRIRTSGAMDPRYICEMVNSPHGQKYFQTRAKSSSGLNTINSSVVREYTLPKPPIEVQHRIVAVFSTLSAELELVTRRLTAARKVMNYTLAEISGHKI